MGSSLKESGLDIKGEWARYQMGVGSSLKGSGLDIKGEMGSILSGSWLEFKKE